MAISIGIGNYIGKRLIRGSNKDYFPEGLVARYACYDKTNEDEDRDILKDLSGNGHDIQLYNFAFSEESGYGKYIDNLKFTVANSSQAITSNTKITINYAGTIGKSIGYRSHNVERVSSIKYKITGLKENQWLYFGYDASYKEQAFLIVKEDGIYDINWSLNTFGPYDCITPNFQGECNITIEIIPEYKGALVSDGVDDYGLCENFPILDKDRGFTVFAIRKWITIKQSSSYSIGKNDQMFYQNNAAESQYNTTTSVSFGSYTPINEILLKNNIFTYQTSNIYNGINTSKGWGDYNGSLFIFTNKKSTLDWCSNIALYALEIYDRDLTDEEIEKVKARMITEYEAKTGEKYPIEYPGLIAAWDVKGKTNYDSERDVLKDLTGNGHDITLYNFAFNEQSGYNNDALVFDGIDDCGVNENMPILTDYTIIAKRQWGETKNNGALFSKRLENELGAFTFELFNSSGSFLCRSFGLNTTDLKLENKEISWQTKKYYNNLNLSIGSKVDTNFVSLGAGYRINNVLSEFFSGSFYCAYLFDRSLTTEEIETFIKKYIDKDYVLPNV